jgi:hypothetical protein
MLIRWSPAELFRRNRLFGRRHFWLIGLLIGFAQELVDEVGTLLLRTLLLLLFFLRFSFGEPVVIHFPAHRILHRDGTIVDNAATGAAVPGHYRRRLRLCRGRPIIASDRAEWMEKADGEKIGRPFNP